jgi:uncharacterized protein YkwD
MAGIPGSSCALAAIAAAVCLCAAVIAPRAAAAPADEAAALSQYQAVQADGQVPAGWTGSVDGCVVGTESDASLNATLHTINVMRDFAGVAPVRLDPSLNHRALAASLMMTAANGQLDHEPGPGWPCYTQEGAAAAGSSNLSGYSGAQAMVDYVLDEGTSDLGHRRWLLNPGATAFGTGSTGVTNALDNLEGPEIPIPAGTLVSWPPAGFVPWPWVPGDWSVAVGGASDGDDVSLAGARIAVDVDGSPVGVTNVRSLPPVYGPSETLGWHVDLPTGLTAERHSIHVTVKGVTENGAAVPIDYAVSAFPVSGAPAPAKACKKAQRKLATAKRKLHRLRAHSARHHRIAKAKKRVRRAKQQVRSIC